MHDLSTRLSIPSSLPHALALAAVLALPAVVLAQDAVDGNAANPVQPGPSAADFNLFEPVQVTQQDAAGNRRPDRPGQSSPASRNTVASPVFTLVGASRIGDRRTVILRHMDGDAIPVPLRSSVGTPIPGHPSYMLVGAEGKTVSVRYPDHVPCQKFAEEGVNCSDQGNIALLSLTNAEALVAPDTAPVPAEESPETTAETAGNGQNPFELLRQRAANGEVNVDSDASARRFRPRRIDPADVPPGMRVVSTPFGDRLVEDRP